MKVVGSAVINDDYWADTGGKTLSSLERLLSEHLGGPYRIDELQLVTSVEEMRAIVTSHGSDN